MEEKKKRKAVYNPEADKRYREKNPEHRRYLNDRSAARRFISQRATPEDLAEVRALLEAREKELAE